MWAFNLVFHCSVSEDNGTAVVVHASVPFSLAHLEETPEDVCKNILLPDVLQLVPELPNPTYCKFHKWRFSQVDLHDFFMDCVIHKLKWQIEKGGLILFDFLCKGRYKPFLGGCVFSEVIGPQPKSNVPIYQFTKNILVLYFIAMANNLCFSLYTGTQELHRKPWGTVTAAIPSISFSGRCVHTVKLWRLHWLSRSSSRYLI
jgi:hypothetical protein